MPIFIIPVGLTLIYALLMTFVIGAPISYIMNKIGEGFKTIFIDNDTSSVGVKVGVGIGMGLIIGAMAGFDMGGPINKSAFTFGIMMITAGDYAPHAAVMAGGMVPPLGIALATTFFKNKFTKEEIDTGKTCYIMGLSFITEGAIPFAAADPMRVIPASIIGASIAGALSMYFGVLLPAPHGGIFVIPVVTHPIMYLASIIIGSVVTALILGYIKKPVTK